MSAAVESRPHRRGIVAVGAGSLLASGIFVARTSFTMRGHRTFSLFDDAMISMTYARNLAHGHGLVWNPGGPKVEGVTNPLWTFVLAVPHALGAADRLAALPVMFLGALLLVAAAVLASRVARQLAPWSGAVGIVAAVLVAFDYGLVYWTLRGMEVGFLTVVALGAVLLALRVDEQRRRDIEWMAALSVVGVSTRLDFVVIVGAVVVFVAWRYRDAFGRRMIVATTAATAAALLVQEVARRAYYGDWVPNTYRLKVDGIGLTTRLHRGLVVDAYALVEEVGVVVLLAVVALVLAKRAERHGRDALLLPIGVFAATVGYSTYVGGDAWEWMRYPNRYLTPGVAVLSTAAAVGIVQLAAALRTRRVWVATLGIAVFLALAGWSRPFDEPLLQMTGKLVDRAAVHGTAVFFVGGVALALAAARFGSRVATALLTLGVVATLSVPAVRVWTHYNAVHVRDDARMSRYGLLLRDLTTPDASIAVVWAGAPVYFAHRQAIDLLGKSDEAIATSSPHAEVPFRPGHVKWNNTISFGVEHPDVVAQVWTWNGGTFDYLVAQGYQPAVPIAAVDRDHVFRPNDPPLFVRAGSSNVRWSELRVLDPAALRARYAGAP